MDPNNELGENALDKPPQKSPLAFRILLYSLLILVTIAGALYWGRVIYYEHALRVYAQELIQEANEQELLPLEPGKSEGPEVEVNCSFEPFLVGDPVGKIRLTVRPEQSSKVRVPYTIAYICAYENGDWHKIESYHEH